MPSNEENTGGPLRLSDVAVGALAEAEQATLRVLGLLRRDVAGRRRALSDGTAAHAAGLRRRVTELAERGAAERLRGRTRVTASLDAVVTAVAASPVLSHAVDAQLDRVLRPLVDVVLDEVLDLLEREPERIRALVRSQRSTMVDELVGRVRSGAAAGDNNVDRILHQSPAAVPPGEPR